MIDLLEIREKRKGNPLAMVSPDDFASAKVGDVDPSLVVTDPTISLYCLDHAARCALFVQVPGGTDITAAAFLYMAQYDHAQRLLAVPYDVFHRVAADINLRVPLVFVHSTGRAGSTLVSKAFGEMAAVTSLSEPDIYTQAVALRLGGVPESEIRDILASATKILFNPAFTRGTTLNVVKFRNIDIEVGDLLSNSFPQAGNLFLYRDLAPFLRSWARAFSLDSLLPDLRRDFIALFALLMPRFAEELRNRPDIGGLELFCIAWLSVMHAYARLHRAGISMLAVRYEDLVADPSQMLESILTYLGLPADRVQSALGAFDRDSQAGSPLSREKGAHRTGEIDGRQWDLVRDLLRRYPLTGGGIPNVSVVVP